MVRIRLNHGSRLNEEGFYAEAIVELDLAIGLADLGGYAALQAIALSNRGGPTPGWAGSSWPSTTSTGPPRCSSGWGR